MKQAKKYEDDFSGGNIKQADSMNALNVTSEFEKILPRSAVEFEQPLKNETASVSEDLKQANIEIYPSEIIKEKDFLLKISETDNVTGDMKAKVSVYLPDSKHDLQVVATVQRDSHSIMRVPNRRNSL